MHPSEERCADVRAGIDGNQEKGVEMYEMVLASRIRKTIMASVGVPVCLGVVIAISRDGDYRRSRI